MISKTTEKFWKYYDGLPGEIKKQAKQAFNYLLRNPYHPSLRFKKIHSTRPIFSVRISKDYRAIGILQDDEITWFWIGSHSDYDKLSKSI